jgi:RNA polymerase sigma-70 factor (ECF subfamily)
MNSDAMEGLAASRQQFLAFIERRVENRDIAEEILQEAFVRGMERAGQVRSGERIVAWFYRLLRNAIVDHWRDRRVERRAVEQMALEMKNAHIPAPEVEAELCRCITSQLGKLRPDYAEILRRVDLGGERPVDFAIEQGLTANNAMVRLHRARRALRERLLHLCGACAEHACLDCGCKGGGSHPSAGVRGERCMSPDRASTYTNKGPERN